MKHVVPSVVILFLLCFRANAGDLYQTFESGETTSTTWGSVWNNGSIVPGFLDASVGGLSAGSGSSTTQNYYRNFAGNSVGINVTNQPYYISMYIQIDPTNVTPNSGTLDIIDGQKGSAAADIQINSPGNGQLNWTAQNGNNNFTNFGISMTLSQPYRLILAINPITQTYSATVESVDTYGNILQSATLNNLAGDPNAFNNHANGNLLVYLQASAGDANVLVDNIHISDSAVPTPEPSALALAAGGLASILYLKGRAAGHNSRLINK